ncbi:hypothetical protein Pedsa_3269 [Pseudopedobacter saltans DSM 12145]|uniref:DUF4292 domain-containing protein n=2 Tax=Pseudopedobacter saltans TaxID=151895 RepID=F0SBW3_PSESL|nr:hypothetical protein Pedsa_3269 [Pseudopedobacter saltans DSM 12145]
MSSKYLFILILPFLWSCAAKKQLHEVKQKEVPKSVDISINDLKNAQLNYETFTTKGKANFSLDGKGYDVTVNLRNKKGEALWLSVTYMAGLEAARLMITPDSVKLLNRLTSEYAAYPFEFIHRYTTKQIDFNELEAMLVGNTLNLILESRPLVERENGVILYRGSSGDLKFESIYSSLFKPKQLILQKENPSQALNISYDSYAQIAEKLLPFKIEINSSVDTKNAKVILEYLNPQFNVPFELPFSVPKRFTRIE